MLSGYHTIHRIVIYTGQNKNHNCLVWRLNGTQLIDWEVLMCPQYYTILRSQVISFLCPSTFLSAKVE